MVTETVTTKAEDKALKRVSDSHQEGRAFDVSTRGWNDWGIQEFMSSFESKYKALGAIGHKDGKPVLIVRHDTGRGDHFHIQINKKYAVSGLDPLKAG